MPKTNEKKNFYLPLKGFFVILPFITLSGLKYIENRYLKTKKRHFPLLY
jgi:hypothetical protein